MSKTSNFAWHDLTVEDAESVKDFYTEILGLRSEAVDMGDYNDYNMINENDEIVAGICHKRGVNSNIPSQWMNYFTVTNIEDKLNKVEKLGGKIISPLNPDSEYKMAIIQYNAGAFIALFEPN